jgi:hypothetical protein
MSEVPNKDEVSSKHDSSNDQPMASEHGRSKGGSYRKRTQPVCASNGTTDAATESSSEDSSEADAPLFNKRKQPGGSSDLLKNHGVKEPPPLDDDEKELERISQIAGKPRSGYIVGSAAKKLLFSLIILGFALLAWVVLVDLIFLVSLIVAWPTWAQFTAMVVLLSACAFVFYRVGCAIYRISQSPLMVFNRVRRSSELNAAKRDAIRISLLEQLSEIEKYPEGRDAKLLETIGRLKAGSEESGSLGWLRDYRNSVHEKLTITAESRVNQIALLAGSSAALSPWRALDVCIALNACMECASEILKEFGVRPNSAVILKFTFDSLLASFFALNAQQVSEDFAQQASERIASEIGKTVAEKVASKVGEGITVAFFVRRVGRRMIRQMDLEI